MSLMLFVSLNCESVRCPRCPTRCLLFLVRECPSTIEQIDTDVIRLCTHGMSCTQTCCAATLGKLMLWRVVTYETEEGTVSARTEPINIPLRLGWTQPSNGWHSLQ